MVDYRLSYYNPNGEQYRNLQKRKNDCWILYILTKVK